MKHDFRSGYELLVRKRVRQHGPQKGAERSVGDEFHGMGQLQLLLLQHYGLRPDESVVEVGCGAGRLAVHLARYLKGTYRGFDVVPYLVRHAQRITRNDRFSFAVADGWTIPLAEGTTDRVCAFSVLTHLLPEHGFRYLREMRRVLRPGGQGVVSFLDIEIPQTWPLFEQSCQDLEKNTPLNTFLSRSHLLVWLNRLNLEALDFMNGDAGVIGAGEHIILDDGRQQTGPFALGQSVCVFRKPVE